jgi:hypothetical protein
MTARQCQDNVMQITLIWPANDVVYQLTAMDGLAVARIAALLARPGNSTSHFGR